MHKVPLLMKYSLDAQTGDWLIILIKQTDHRYWISSLIISWANSQSVLISNKAVKSFPSVHMGSWKCNCHWACSWPIHPTVNHSGLKTAHSRIRLRTFICLPSEPIWWSYIHNMQSAPCYLWCNRIISFLSWSALEYWCFGPLTT